MRRVVRCAAAMAAGWFNQQLYHDGCELGNRVRTGCFTEETVQKTGRLLPAQEFLGATWTTRLN